MRHSVEGRPLDERDLLASARNGDTRAFEELVRIHQATALRVAYNVLRDGGEAEDVTQDAFVKAYRALSRFNEGAEFRPWVLRIVRNEALNRVRGGRRRERLALQTLNDPVSGGAAPSPETEVISAADRDRLLSLIDELPQRYREVVVHRYLLELTEEETAAVLGVPRGTVKSRTSRAMERLRQLLILEGDST